MCGKIIDKIKVIFGIVSDYKYTTPRAALSAFLKAIDTADIDEDGELKVKELFKLYKNSLVNTAVLYEMTSSEIKTFIDDFCKRM